VCSYGALLFTIWETTGDNGSVDGPTLDRGAYVARPARNGRASDQHCGQSRPSSRDRFWVGLACLHVLPLVPLTTLVRNREESVGCPSDPESGRGPRDAVGHVHYSEDALVLE
jgi:hypothetical protein